VIAQEPQHPEEQDDADGGPHHLVRGVAARRGLPGLHRLGRCGEVQAVDHHQAQSVEQRHARQDQRIGVGRELADRQVGDGEQPEVSTTVEEQVGGQLLFLVDFHQYQGCGGDQGGEDQHEQLGAASGTDRGAGNDPARRSRRSRGGGHQLSAPPLEPAGRLLSPVGGPSPAAGVRAINVRLSRVRPQVLAAAAMVALAVRTRVASAGARRPANRGVATGRASDSSDGRWTLMRTGHSLSWIQRESSRCRDRAGITRGLC